MALCVDDVLDAQTLRILRMPVVVHGDPEKTVRNDAGKQLEALAPGQHPVSGGALPHGKQVVGDHPGPDRQLSAAGRAVDRNGQLGGANQVRRVPQQSLPFPESLVNQPDLPRLEIPDAAMDQSRRRARGLRSEVRLLDEKGAEPPQRKLARNAAPVNPATYHDDVELRQRHRAMSPYRRDTGVRVPRDSGVRRISWSSRAGSSRARREPVRRRAGEGAFVPMRRVKERLAAPDAVPFRPETGTGRSR